MNLLRGRSNFFPPDLIEGMYRSGRALIKRERLACRGIPVFSSASRSALSCRGRTHAFVTDVPRCQFLPVQQEK
jgi:hypothetical protein